MILGFPRIFQALNEWPQIFILEIRCHGCRWKCHFNFYIRCGIIPMRHSIPSTQNICPYSCLSRSMNNIITKIRQVHCQSIKSCKGPFLECLDWQTTGHAHKLYFDALINVLIFNRPVEDVSAWHIPAYCKKPLLDVWANSSHLFWQIQLENRRGTFPILKMPLLLMFVAFTFIPPPL